MGRWLDELRQKNQKTSGEEPTKPSKTGFCGFCRFDEVGFSEKTGGEALASPKHQDLPAHPGDWPEEWLEAYIERAGIMEFDGGLPRIEAERRAEELVREAYRRTGGCQ